MILAVRPMLTLVLRCELVHPVDTAELRVLAPVSRVSQGYETPANPCLIIIDLITVYLSLSNLGTITITIQMPKYRQG